VLVLTTESPLSDFFVCRNKNPPFCRGCRLLLFRCEIPGPRSRFIKPCLQRFAIAFSGKSRRRGAFSLLEVLVVCALLLLTFTVCYSIVDSTSSAWITHRARLSSFEGARVGFEMLTNRLAQATLNTYWDYNDTMTQYLRKSELHFVSGDTATLSPALSGGVAQSVFFMAPLGFTSDPNNQPLTRMLSGCGFYVRFSGDVALPAFLEERDVKPRYRYRLFQFLQPGENLRIYKEPSGTKWFSDTLLAESFPMIDNVIGLILRASYSTGSGASAERMTYEYDTRAGMQLSSPPPTCHQLPPSVSVTMVVIDEDSAIRLATIYGENILPPASERRFSVVDNYESDLDDWETLLNEFVPKINYRIFTADVPIRGAKWSSE
jgi:uncharacterized protein (TIGR02599 family)